MKGNRSLLATTLAISLAILPSAIAVDKTSSKAAGPSPTTVVNTILSGSGAPAKTLGINGDFYIDTKNLNLYGPKTKGVWKIATSLKVKDVPVVANVIGESGAIGQTGAKGATGDKGATGATGAQGIQGLTGPIGVTGLAGASGATGSAGTPGVAGAKGDTGAQGSQGASGASGASGSAGTPGVAGAKGDAGAQGSQGASGASGASGSAGTPGVAGAKGDAGAQGIQGVKGDTGATGAQGDSAASVVKFVTVPAGTLTITTAGNSISQTFFTAETAGNYTFEVIVVGIANFSETFKLNAEIVIGNSAIVNQFAIAADANSYANRTLGRQYGFTVIGAAADISAGAIFAIRITNQVALSGGTPINFTGRALVQKVGSIG
jgi:hypothetical protein